MTGWKAVWASLAVLSAGVLVGGCGPHKLGDDLAEFGITPAKTARLRLIGSEADFGTTKVRAVVTDKETIQAVWGLIESAEPADVWHASGYRNVEFYLSQADGEPAAVLRVNAGDLCHVAGSRRYYYDHQARKTVGLFRCAGLHRLLMARLAAEHRRQQGPPR